MSTDDTSVISRLCAACGMCCNGVMFHNVRLQGADSARELSELGLKTKRKKGMRILLQPCPAHQANCCTIYEHRPERCRIFECRQLQRFKAREISESDVMEKILAAGRLVADVRAIFDRAGEENVRNPIAKRAENVLANPAEESSEPERFALHRDLSERMLELEELLERDFRVK